MTASALILGKRRPCYVRDQKALFHSWCQESYVIRPSPLIGGHPGGTVCTVKGVVEFEDGSVHVVCAEDIRFADGGEFNEFAYTPNPSDKEEK